MLYGGHTFKKYFVALPCKEGDLMLNGSSGERSQSLACFFAWLSYMRKPFSIPEALKTVRRQLIGYSSGGPRLLYMYPGNSSEI